MSGTIKHLRIPRSSRSDQSQAPVFVTAILVFAVVASVLFFSGGRGIAPSIASTHFGAKTNGRSLVPRTSTGVVTPAIRFGQPTLVVLNILNQSSPTPVPSATFPPTPSITPQIAISGTPRPTASLVGHVGNTGGDGVYLRRTPRLADRWIVWVDSTPLVLLGNETDGDGQHWLQVRDPANNVGWIPAQYVTL